MFFNLEIYTYHFIFAVQWFDIKVFFFLFSFFFSFDIMRKTFSPQLWMLLTNQNVESTPILIAHIICCHTYYCGMSNCKLWPRLVITSNDRWRDNVVRGVQFVPCNDVDACKFVQWAVYHWRGNIWNEKKTNRNRGLKK